MEMDTKELYVNVTLKLFCLRHGMITDVNIPEDRNSHLLLSYPVMLSPSGCMIYTDKQPQSIPMPQTNYYFTYHRQGVKGPFSKCVGKPEKGNDILNRSERDRMLQIICSLLEYLGYHAYWSVSSTYPFLWAMLPCVPENGNIKCPLTHNTHKV